MGKDIDRNITRQLYERFKNFFNRNDIIPVENGGTGVNSLNKFYPKLVTDYKITNINILSIPLNNGFTWEKDSHGNIEFCNKSIYIEAHIHIKRDPTISEVTFLTYKTKFYSGYNINKIKIAPYATSMYLIDDTFSLSGYFNDAHEYNNTIYAFIPLI